MSILSFVKAVFTGEQDKVERSVVFDKKYARKVHKAASQSSMATYVGRADSAKDKAVYRAEYVSKKYKAQPMVGDDVQQFEQLRRMHQSEIDRQMLLDMQLQQHLDAHRMADAAHQNIINNNQSGL